MKVDILYPQLPPMFDAIGEHNVRLARALCAHGVTVRLLHRSAEEPALPGVESVRVGSATQGMADALSKVVAAGRPNWVITGYNPFGYGRYGVAPGLVVGLRRARAGNRGVNFALYVHEAYVPLTRPKLMVLGAAQRAQLRVVAGAQDVILTATEAWTEDLGRWLPKRPTYFVPVGSNLPQPGRSRTAVRSRLGLAETDLVVATFGGLGADRRPDLLAAVFSALRGRRPVALYVGPSGEQFRRSVGDCETRLVELGPLPASDAADTLAAADLGLAPFAEGVSARRGSFLAMLQQGLPTVTTEGALTGRLLRGGADRNAFTLTTGDQSDFAAAAVALADDAARRRRMSAAARAFHADEFDWGQIAVRYLDVFRKEVTSHDEATTFRARE